MVSEEWVIGLIVGVLSYIFISAILKGVRAVRRRRLESQLRKVAEEFDIKEMEGGGLLTEIFVKAYLSNMYKFIEGIEYFEIANESHLIDPTLQAIIDGLAGEMVSLSLSLREPPTLITYQVFDKIFKEVFEERSLESALIKAQVVISTASALILARKLKGKKLKELGATKLEGLRLLGSSRGAEFFEVFVAFNLRKSKGVMWKTT